MHADLHLGGDIASAIRSYRYFSVRLLLWYFSMSFLFLIFSVLIDDEYRICLGGHPTSPPGTASFLSELYLVLAF